MIPGESPPRSLDAWLAFIERQHGKPIDLSLERMREVQRRLGLALDGPVITVGGTNGKGSICAMLESVLRSAGYRTALYTSPHLLRYNERVRVEGVEMDDASLCRAFAAVEAARGEVPLTYFEFGTLAALRLFAESKIDVAVLEVGLGGRLDAVNVIDADAAVLASIGMDHMDYLGPTRDDIGREKAGIFRPGRPAVCGDPDPPASVPAEAARIGADLWLADRDFGWVADRQEWRFWSPRGRRSSLPHPALRGPFQIANAATALAALDALRERLPVPMGAVRDGLLAVSWPGRFQVLPGRPMVILDVAHNPPAARALAEGLEALPRGGRILAVAGVLGDKDATGIAAALATRIDRWFLASLAGPRGRSAESLRSAVLVAGVDAARVTEYVDPQSAFVAACDQASETDKILVFGSFLTVSAVLAHRRAALP